jgi:hypothetical protein
LLAVVVLSGTLALDLTPPQARPEHNNLITLFEDGSPEEYQFKRLDMLSLDYLFVAAHGIGNSKDGITSVTDKRSGRVVEVTVEKLAQIIREQKEARGLPDQMPIYLMACNAGAGNNAFAKRLSELLQVEVVAPDEWLVVDQLGISRTGDNLLTAYFNYGKMSFKRFPIENYN